MLMFTLGFLSGSYFSVFFVSLVVLSHLAVDESFATRLIESLLWPYHLLDLMFGKDEEE